VVCFFIMVRLKIKTKQGSYILAVYIWPLCSIYIRQLINRASEFLKHFAGKQKGLKVLKIASTTGEMFSTTLFSIWSTKWCRLCPKKHNPTVAYPFLHLIFQPLVAFYLFTAYFSLILIKMLHFELFETFPLP
jgi:hypothetical protein